MNYFIPGNLDLDTLIQTHPPSQIDKFNLNHLIYILHLLVSIPASNKDLEIEDGYIPINAQLLQRYVKNYRQYLDYLIFNGIVFSNNSYTKGKKSIGYKYTELYSKTIQKVAIIDKRFLKSIKHNPSIPLYQRKRYDHLLGWYNESLQIDSQQATEYLLVDLLRKLAYNKEVNTEAPNRQRDPYLQYNCSIVRIEKILSGTYSLSVDGTVGRLHSAITNMNSQLRNYLTYSNKDLVSVDIKNSQPYLSILLLNPQFWDSTVNGSLITLKKIALSRRQLSYYTYIYSSFISSIYVMLSKKKESRIHSEFQRYQDLVQNGQFHEYMQTEIEHRTGKVFTSRRASKATVFQILFTDNRFIGQIEAQPKRIFKELFPSVYEVFSLVKKKDKADLPRLLQRIESYLLLDVITRRISKDRSDLPIFTIHDSIVTTVGNERYVRQIMQEELMKAIGTLPQLAFEYWLPENVKFSDGTVYLPKNSKAA